jgi:SUMO ligase MMS21 Smc5/6 complex component
MNRGLKQIQIKKYIWKKQNYKNKIDRTMKKTLGNPAGRKYFDQK